MIVEDLTMDPKLAWVAGFLATAKKLLEEQVNQGGELMTVVFMKTLAGVGVVGTHMTSDAAKDATLFWLRRTLREEGATASLVVSDTFVNAGKTADALQLMAEAGGPYSTWPKSLQAMVRRREAITAVLEEPAGRHRLITQYYRREGKRIVFEELDVADEEVGDLGRFSNLLPRTPP